MKENISAKDFNTLYVSSIAATVGVVFNTFSASIGEGSAMYGTGLIVAGACSAVWHLTHTSKFDRLFKNLELGVGTAYPMLKGKKKTTFSTIYKFTLPTGLCSDDFDKHKQAIEQYLGREIEITYTFKEIQIEVFNNKMKTIYPYTNVDCKGLLEFPIGYNRKGELITCDLSSGEPHLLIAGETGSGKSTVLRSIITNIILNKPKIKLHLIDLKRGAEFQIFGRCKNVFSFARNISQAYDVLSSVNNEVNRRYDLFYKNDVVDIKEYNRKIGHMDYELLIVDEFADLKQQKNCIELLEEISAKARACGIHLIISTQRPDAQVLNGRVKANVTAVLGLKTSNAINSRIIIDDIGLEELRGKGQGIYKRGTPELLQCMYLASEEARKLLKSTYVEKNIQVDNEDEQQEEGELLI